MKKVLCTLSLWTALAALASAATTYNLTTDISTSGHNNPFGTWAYQYAGHTPSGYTYGSWDQNPSNYTTFSLRDWNPGYSRDIWYTGTDVFSQPAVQINNYSDNATRAVYLECSNTMDSIVKWTSPVTGAITISGFLTDASPQAQGALMFITKYTGSGLDTNTLQDVWVSGGGRTDFNNLTTTVNAGDILYFRRTYAWAPDNYGKWISQFDVTVSAVPEPACLSLLALGAVGLLRRRRE